MDVSRLLTQTVTVKSRTGIAGTGKPTYGSGRSVSCRVEHAKGLGPASAGTQDTQRFTLVTTEQLLPTDLVWLPGANTSDEAAARSPGPTGVQPAVALRSSSISFYETVL